MDPWLQWATVLGLGGILTKTFDALVAGIKEARAARHDPQDEIEMLRRSRYMWMDLAMATRRLAINCGVDLKDIPPMPDDDPISQIRKD
ncbi:MAG: hypothetical protein ACOYD1_07800 [Candidatus Nanopelagicales bacterium]